MCDTTESIFEALLIEASLQGITTDEYVLRDLAQHLAAERIEWGDVSISAAIHGLKVGLKNL